MDQYIECQKFNSKNTNSRNKMLRIFHLVKDFYMYQEFSDYNGDYEGSQ